jgi:hypothetical protein
MSEDSDYEEEIICLFNMNYFLKQLQFGCENGKDVIMYFSNCTRP